MKFLTDDSTVKTKSSMEPISITVVEAKSITSVKTMVESTVKTNSMSDANSVSEPNSVADSKINEIF